MIPLIAPLLSSTVSTLAMSFLSEKLLIQVTFLLLNKLVKSTKNDLDDQILASFEKALSVKK